MNLYDFGGTIVNIDRICAIVEMIALAPNHRAIHGAKFLLEGGQEITVATQDYTDFLAWIQGGGGTIHNLASRHKAETPQG